MADFAPPPLLLSARKPSAVALRAALRSGLGSAAIMGATLALLRYVDGHERRNSAAAFWLVEGLLAAGFGAWAAYGTYDRLRRHEAAARGEYAVEVYGGRLARLATSWWALVPTCLLAWLLSRIITAWLVDFAT